jgi:pyruvate dehydrogenase E1 component
LRDHFEIDSRYITLATLSGLSKEKKIGQDVIQQAVKDLQINPEKANPMIS